MNSTQRVLIATYSQSFAVFHLHSHEKRMRNFEENTQETTTTNRKGSVTHLRFEDNTGKFKENRRKVKRPHNIYNI